MKKLFFLGCMGVFLFSAVTATAQVRLSSMETTLVAGAGTTASGSVTVKNASPNSITVRVYAEDFIYTAPFKGTKAPQPANSHSRSCAEWITPAREVVEIPAKSEQTIAYSVAVPEGVSGQYWAVLFFEKAPTPVQFTDYNGYMAELPVAIRLGHSLFVETPDAKRMAQVSLRGQGVALLGNLTNTGNVILKSRKASFYALDTQGTVVDRGKLTGEKLFLPPEKSADIALELTPQLSPGNYTLVITLDLEQDNVLVKEIDFNKSADSSIQIIAVRD